MKLRHILKEKRQTEIGLNLISADKNRFIINRKLGLQNIIKDADTWNIIQGREEDWVTNNHNFTFFLWNQRIG